MFLKNGVVFLGGGKLYYPGVACVLPLSSSSSDPPPWMGGGVNGTWVRFGRGVVEFAWVWVALGGGWLGN